MNFILDEIPHLENLSDINKHILLLYNESEHLYETLITYLNKTLKQNRLAVYCYFTFPNELKQKMKNEIIDHDENLSSGKLSFNDIKSAYIDARDFDHTGLDKLVISLKTKMTGLDATDIGLAGHAAETLFKNKHIDACVALEKWWQNQNIVRSVICPFPIQLFAQKEYYDYIKVLQGSHDVIVRC